MHVPGTVNMALPDALRLPHVREQFTRVMEAGKADAKPDEINWDRVIELWNIKPKCEGTLL